MDCWLSSSLMHTALLIVSLLRSCHCGMYDQVIPSAYSTAYGVPMVYTYPYSGAYYGQRLIPVNPMAHMYGNGNYPLIRNAGLYLTPYPGADYNRRTSAMEDDNGDDHHQLQTNGEPYKISLMTDNVQQMMNNGQKEVLSMMSTGGDQGSRLARILVKQRRAAQDGQTEAAAETTPSSWYRDASYNPTPTYYPTGTTQGNLYPNLSPYMQPMNYNPTGMMNNPMGGYPNPSPPTYGYNNMNYPSYPSPQYPSSAKQSSTSFMDTVITALPEIRKLTTIVAPYVMGGPSARTARHNEEYMLSASNPIVSPYITRKTAAAKNDNLQQTQTVLSNDGTVQTDSDMPYNDDSSERTLRLSLSPYQSLYSSVGDATNGAVDYPYAYRVYIPDAKAADDGMYKDGGYDNGSYSYGDDDTMAYGDSGDLYRLSSGLYS